jgi:hypothetical protein
MADDTSRRLELLCTFDHVQLCKGMVRVDQMMLHLRQKLDHGVTLRATVEWRFV